MAFKNQYYDDALAHPDNYTWGIWDSSKPLSPDNWQPRPRQSGDARDPSNQRSNTSVNSRPVTVTSGANVSSQQNNTLDELTKQFYEYAKNNRFDSAYPKFNYDPSQGVIDAARMNADQYNQWKDSVIFNQDMAYRDLQEKDKASNAMANTASQRRWQEDTQKQQMQSQMDTAKAERDRVNKMLEDQRKPISFTTTTPQQMADWVALQKAQGEIQARNEGLKQAEINNQDISKQQRLLPLQTQFEIEKQKGLSQVELDKQSRLIPMQTQATMQINAPNYESLQKVADIQAQAQKAVALANAQAQRYQADATKTASMYGSDATKTASMYGSDATKAATQYSAEMQKAIAQLNANAQMYGANMNAMSNMFGSQMNAVGNMFGGMNTGGNARYW